MSLAVHPKDIVEASESPLLASAEHWERKPLGEVATILNGYAFSSKLFSRAEGVPLIRIRDISKGTTTERFKGQFEERYLIRSGDLLVGMDGDFNVARWSGPHALLNQRVMKIEPKPGILDTEFLFHLLPGYLQAIHDLTSSTTVKHLSSKDVERLPIPVPKIEEQRRIAAQIATLVELVESSNGHLVTIPALLRKFRQSVLAAACSGQLTADWRGTDETVCWEELTLADLIIGKPKNGYSAKPVGYHTQWKVLTLTATTSGRFDPTQFKYFDETIPEDSPFWVRDGEIYFQRGNTIEYVGTPALYRGKDQEFIYPDLLMRVQANEKALPEFLVLACANESARQYLRDNATGSQGSMPKINQPTLMSLPLFVPGTDEQVEIVRRVESLFSLADSIESRLAEATAQIECTAQAILAKAFRGELC